MKNLRGRPNNINGRSGILYISDSEDDSDFSDSDVEPVFFPPPFLPPQANILLLAAAAVGQDDTDDDDVIISDVESDLADLHDDDDEDVDSEDLVELYHGDNDNAVIVELQGKELFGLIYCAKKCHVVDKSDSG